MIVGKHRRDREQLETDLEERKHTVKKLEAEFKEFGSQKVTMKKQIDEYEIKIKRLILEFEEESKKHIRELNEVHEQYRGYKSTSIELEQRIHQYKADMQKALEGERNSKKELHRVRLDNDEHRERLRFIEQRYNSLVQRFGASPEDLQEIDEQLMRNGSPPALGNIQSTEDNEAHVIYNKKGGFSAQARNSHLKN